MFAPALSTLPPSMAVVHRGGHDYMDVGGRVTPGAVTEESEAAL